VSRLSGTLSRWEKTLAGIDPNDSEKVKAVHENIAYYERELRTFKSWHESKDLARQLNARLT